VLSVKLYFHVPPKRVRRVALDEGSRTSAALTQILLAELCDIDPDWETLPIGCGLEDTDADAVLLIGDRAIQSGERGPESREQGAGSGEQSPNGACEVWDLGDVWCRWTGLPFVFAMWTARPDVDTAEITRMLAAARDEGVRGIAQIASREASALQIPGELALRYLRDNLHFTLGRRERHGMRTFYQLCVARGMAPHGMERALEEFATHDCPAS
jgi:chorismate dehydratase